MLDFNKIKTILEYQLDKYKELNSISEIIDFEILELVVNDFIYYEFGYEKDLIKACYTKNMDLKTNSTIMKILEETESYLESINK